MGSNPTLSATFFNHLQPGAGMQPAPIFLPVGGRVAEHFSAALPPYLHFGPDTVTGWYELNEVDAIGEWTSYARSELGVPEGFIALTSIEGQGITLCEQSSGRVFDVEFGQFDKLAAGELRPIAGSFVEFLRCCEAKSVED